MSSALDVSVGIVAYLALFAGFGIAFLFVNLLVGKFVRADNPHPEKLEIYECGEPTIGSSFVQFDLRFYVVALLFIIFDVEVAFFFPWATVYGKATHLADAQFEAVTATADGKPALTRDGRDLYRELGVANPAALSDVPASLEGRVAAGLDEVSRARELARKGARQLAGFTLIDIAVFFSVLMVGFAYVWRRGDLDWVRAVSRERAAERGNRSARGQVEESPVLSA
ncbi:MAG: NADH-quinone oxidoreductase subunit A [Pirellulales bacterium]|jgi:NADH-quinone oxidoreductase subunit A